MKNFVEDNKFVLIATFLEGLPSKVSKKFFDAAEFSGSQFLNGSILVDFSIPWYNYPTQSRCIQSKGEHKTYTFFPEIFCLP